MLRPAQLVFRERIKLNKKPLQICKEKTYNPRKEKKKKYRDAQRKAESKRRETDKRSDDLGCSSRGPATSLSFDGRRLLFLFLMNASFFVSLHLLGLASSPATKSS